MIARTLALAVALHSIPVGEQARDTAPAAFGGCSLAGHVVRDDESASPLRRATITIQSTANPRIRHLTTTGDDGRFAFGDLPCGNVVVSAARAGYVTTYYGAVRTGSPNGLPVTLVAGRSHPPLTLTVPKGGVIAGVVTDAQGRPAPGITVRLRRASTLATGERVWQVLTGPVVSGRTDDLGQYRIYGLQEGDYTVFAQPAGLPPGDLRVTTADEVTWALTPQSPAPSAGQVLAPVVVHHPGTTDLAAAAIVSVGPAQERLGVGITLAYSPASSVEGSVVDEAGQPVSGVQVTMLPQAYETVDGTDAATLSTVGLLGGASATTSAADGRFRFAAMPPGGYLLIARRAASNSQVSSWARTTLDVQGVDVTGVALALGPTMTLHGIAELPDGDPPLTGTVSVTLRPVDAAGAAVSATAPVSEDGRFSVTGITPGRYRLSASLRGRFLESAIVGDVDVADHGLVIEAQAPLPVVRLVFRMGGGTVFGVLQAPDGSPASDLFVGVFPTDSSLRFRGSRRLRAPIRVSTAGQFSFGDLPAGDYHLVAVSEAFQREWSSAEFLADLAKASVVVTVGPGGRTEQNVKVAGR